MKILHLYSDIMNLYGDYGNITAIMKLCGLIGEEYTVDRRSIGDAVKLSDYDFIYVGSGTERNMKVALGDLRRLKDELCAYVDSGRAALFTGNAFEMLGKSITDADGTVYEGLGLFDFTVTEQKKTRLVGDVIYDAPFLDSPLVGFINKCSEIRGIGDPLFTVRMGLGNAEGESGEGVRRNNLFCTHLTGPVLVKNPHMLGYIISLILGQPVDTAVLTYEHRGYAVTLRELRKRLDG